MDGIKMLEDVETMYKDLLTAYTDCTKAENDFAIEETNCK